MINPGTLDRRHRSINKRFNFFILRFREQLFSLVKVVDCWWKVLQVNFTYPLGQKQIVQRILVQRLRFFILFIVFYSKLVIVLHEITECTVKIKYRVKVIHLLFKALLLYYFRLWKHLLRAAYLSHCIRILFLKPMPYPHLHLLELLKVLHPLVDLALHQKYHTFNEILKSE